MRWIIPLMLIGGLLICSPASAEFYKYYDENGNVHFTDDFNKVPEDQREAVEGYEESVSEETASEETAEETEPAEMEGETEEETEQETEAAETYDTGRNVAELDERKAEMEQEYQSLVKEKERLNSMRKNVKTQADAQNYNESVKALNQRMQEHDQKRKALVSDIEAHNAKMSEKKAAQQQSAQK